MKSFGEGPGTLFPKRVPAVSLLAGIDRAHGAESRYDGRELFEDIIHVFIGILMTEGDTERSVRVLNGNTAGSKSSYENNKNECNT